MAGLSTPVRVYLARRTPQIEAIVTTHSQHPPPPHRCALSHNSHMHLPFVLGLRNLGMKNTRSTLRLTQRTSREWQVVEHSLACWTSIHATSISSSCTFTMDCSSQTLYEMNSLLESKINTTDSPCPVATVKSNPAFDASLEAKAVTFLKSMIPDGTDFVDAFLKRLASNSDDSLTDFVESIVVLISSANQIITTTTMKMLRRLSRRCTETSRLALVKTDLIRQIINTLNPQSLSFTEAVGIHINVMKTINESFWISSPYPLEYLETVDEIEPQDVHEAVLKHILGPSEQYIWHLCVNRYSLVDGNQSRHFLDLLAKILYICPYHQATMEIVLHMPVFLTIPSCLAFFEHDDTIYWFLYEIINTQFEWHEERGETQQMWKTVLRTLRMEGIEDVTEQKLQTDRYESNAWFLVDRSIHWNNQLGMNIPEEE
ncbi:hypothetical protein BLNAU_18568 [Blattamonas nauphoetae]|uniref:Uncharacterized protein n=1 Tax=Blattamonas nauphoetae TaxID=2049346 RepID=A0ABQ9X787_9EUKA|nr:hypothetical protein BLNAU_18568 [Blattamonas nauphoetae]